MRRFIYQHLPILSDPMSELREFKMAEDHVSPVNKEPSDRVFLGPGIDFPAYGGNSIISNVLFVTGKRGSGKSWSTAVMMEEFNRLGLQFVCFDALDAHGYLPHNPKEDEGLEGVSTLRPQPGETVNMKALVSTLRESDESLVISLAGLPLIKQQEMIAEYCEALLEAQLGKGIMTIFEECQDFIPQLGRPVSFDPIVRLCKLGRALGYGVTLISQRPAGVNKEALSQSSIYIVHNIINSRDLKSLEEQLSFGTDKKLVKKMLDGIVKCNKGEVIVFAPEFFRDRGYVVVGKIRGDRKTAHKGHNVDVQDTRTEGSTPAKPMVPTQDFGELRKLDRPIPPPSPTGSVPPVADLTNESSSPPKIEVVPEMEWDKEPELDVEFTSEIQEGASAVTVAMAVGGLVIFSGLGFVVARGLSQR
jgi:hypothetical protein